MYPVFSTSSSQPAPPNSSIYDPPPSYTSASDTMDEELDADMLLAIKLSNEFNDEHMGQSSVDRSVVYDDFRLAIELDEELNKGKRTLDRSFPGQNLADNELARKLQEEYDREVNGGAAMTYLPKFNWESDPFGDNHRCEPSTSPSTVRGDDGDDVVEFIGEYSPGESGCANGSTARFKQSPTVRRSSYLSDKREVFEILSSDEERERERIKGKRREVVPPPTYGRATSEAFEAHVIPTQAARTINDVSILKSWFANITTVENPASSSFLAKTTPEWRACPSCKNLLPSLHQTIKDVVDDESVENNNFRSRDNLQIKKCGLCTTCDTCKKFMCLVCLSETDPLLIDEFQCCSGGRILALVIALSKMDSVWLEEHPHYKTRKAANASPVKSNRPQKQARRKGRGVGYGEDNCDNSDGYADSEDYADSEYYGESENGDINYSTSHHTYVAKVPSANEMKLREQEKQRAHTAASIFQQLEYLLTENDMWDVSSMVAQHGDVISAMLRTSFLGEKMAQLLRNDSVVDIETTDGTDIYFALLALMRKLIGHKILLDFLTTERRDKKFSTGLGNIIVSLNTAEMVQDSIDESMRAKRTGRGAFARLRRSPVVSAENGQRAVFELEEGDQGIGQPILASFGKLVRQSQVFLQQTSKTIDKDENEAMLLFCADCVGTSHTIDSVVQSMKSAALSDPSSTVHNVSPSSTPKGKGKQLESKNTCPFKISEDMASDSAKLLCSDLQFEFVEDVASTHHYDTQSKNESSAHGKMTWLMKELTTLSTSLPDGIFVRVQEDRPDLLKALIVGPAGTPYEGGLYEFDFWIPGTYPNVPPQVQFKTTGQGTVRFNPNLYNCGKVCLSILGTWSGQASEKWIPKQSTILQVLVSIQSMILCSDPYYNEPGYVPGSHKSAASAYSEQVKHNSVEHAIISPLRFHQDQDGLWQDIIKAHFLANGPEIFKLVKTWASGSSSKRVTSEQRDRFKTELEKFVVRCS